MDRRDRLEERRLAPRYGVAVDTDALVPPVGIGAGRQNHRRIAVPERKSPRAVGIVAKVALLDGVGQVDGRVSFVGPFAA
jgi:hypothetical protein